jgi:repressor LexA
MKPRTHRQKEILDYIGSFIKRHGYEPSYAQIARHFGVSSKATIAKHIEALERRGLLSRNRENGVFGLNIKIEPENGEAIYQLPLLGKIAAGQPIDAIGGIDSISIPRFMLNRIQPENVYALRVAGDSMVEDHICDGDIVLIENRTDAHNGEIVVANIDGDRVTLKRFYSHNGEVELRPANAEHDPMRISAEKVSIQGIFRGLLRPVTV